MGSCVFKPVGIKWIKSEKEAKEMIKRISSIIFSRVFMVAVAILLQLGWLFVILYGFSINSTFANIILKIIAFVNK